MYGATTVPMKWSMGQFALDEALELIAEAGDASQRIMVKTDQENSVKALIEDLVAQREEGRTIVEESPVQSSGSKVDTGLDSTIHYRAVYWWYIVLAVQYSRVYCSAVECCMTLALESPSKFTQTLNFLNF